MTVDQVLTLLVLAGVVVMMIWDRLRADVVALTGAAILLMTGVVRPSEVQGAFASPAIITGIFRSSRTCRSTVSR